MRTRQTFLSALLRAMPVPDENPVALGNRIATQSDRTLYGNFITVGDLIMDTWTKVNPNGTHDASYFFMALSWPQLAGEPTIWFDGDLLCPDGEVLNVIKFQSTSNFDSPWSVNKATFKTIPGTKVYTKAVVCHGLLHWVLEGEGTISPWPASRKFLHGIFSWNIIQPLTISSHGISGSCRTGGTISLKGFEVQHGFSGVRLFTAKNANVCAALTITEFYIHDTESEGFYLGMTSGTGPIPVFRNVNIYQGIIARSGTEPIQLQNFNGSDVHHITVFAADTKWKHAFQNFQSTTIQWVCNGGINKLRNILVNGFGVNGLMPYSLSVASGFTIFSELFNESIASDIAFFQGRSSGSYTNNTANGNGINWIFRDLTFGHFNDTWADYTGETNSQFIITKGNLMTDVITVENLVHDGSKANVFETPAEWNASGTTLDAAMPLPVHINDGFDNHPERVSVWHRYYADYFAGPNGTPTHWLLDEIAMWINVATESYELYKCTTEHDSTADEPPNSPNFGPKLTFDTNAIRSDKPGWNSGTVQVDYGPDNLGLVGGSPYAHLGCQIVYE